MALGGSLNARERSVEDHAEESVKRSAVTEDGGQHASRKFKRSIVTGPCNTALLLMLPAYKAGLYVRQSAASSFRGAQHAVVAKVRVNQPPYTRADLSDCATMLTGSARAGVNLPPVKLRLAQLAKTPLGLR